jgi:pyrroline-5-carboxylate reductase
VCDTVVFPADPLAADIFSPLGGTVEVADERGFDALFAATAGMASYFGMLQAQAEWLLAHGIAYADARRYLASLYFGLANAASVDAAPFSEMSRAYTTPGGLNEQVSNQLAEQGVYGAYQDALEHVFERIQGQLRQAD